MPWRPDLGASLFAWEDAPPSSPPPSPPPRLALSPLRLRLPRPRPASPRLASLHPLASSSSHPPRLASPRLSSPLTSSPSPPFHPEIHPRPSNHAAAAPRKGRDACCFVILVGVGWVLLGILGWVGFGVGLWVGLWCWVGCGLGWVLWFGLGGWVWVGLWVRCCGFVGVGTVHLVQ
ncbi:hypothetical protein BDN70DRAFT_696381 [Pholiota conissans]|uniref:Uncharacterized protein n=1 Tax=Pholiota conissans TaxID=109636 RepID=A0A9P5YK94_9AGAR|nr:hypothetical protein BDN70DRAFT_696381 [Pholiota conissans]